MIFDAITFAVAQATGESLGTIRQLGFSLLNPRMPQDPPEDMEDEDWSNGVAGW